jgi:hypothetical protein
MSERDSQTLVLSRQAVLMVTAVGVGLLTLCYVLGVQVGKQSAAIHQPLAKGADELLEDLPVPLAEQLKSLEGLELEKAQRVVPGDEPAKPQAPKPEAAKPSDPPKGERWTAQLVSTSDSAEADRVVAKAKAAGVSATVVKDKGVFKVRLAKPAPRAEVDAAIAKLKAKGQSAFAVKVD